jgi:hypothetical protein
MRATKRKGKREIRKRFAVVIGVAAVGVTALGAQTGAAAPGVVSYGTELTITYERGNKRGVLWHGGIRSNRKCRLGREVSVFRKRPGPDRKLGADRTTLGANAHNWIAWRVVAPKDGHVYAIVSHKVGDGFVCRADRSRTIVNGRV